MLWTIRHFNKMNGAVARYRAGGSIGWQAKPRVVLSLGRHPNDRDVRVLSFIKGNVEKEPRAATFRVDEISLDGEGVGRVLWGAECDLSADQVHGAESPGPKEPSKTAGLATWMRDRLSNAGDEGLLWSELETDAIKLFKVQRGTVYRARKILGRSIVEFREDHDRPRSPLHLRLRAAP
jgi:hypothetical protein